MKWNFVSTGQEKHVHIFYVPQARMGSPGIRNDEISEGHIKKGGRVGEK